MAHLRRLPIAVLLVATLLALAPATASAALDVKRVGTTLSVTGSTSGDTQIEIDADQSVFVAGSEVAVSTSTPATCTASGSYVECGDADLTSLAVTLTGTGDDTLEIQGAPFTAAATLTINTGPGDDELLFFGEQRVLATLGSGNDRATTADGNDELHGGPGDDELLPGAGNDQLWGEEGADTLRGGPGDDRHDGGPDDDLLDARTGTGTPTSGGDVDTQLICGSGNDGLRRDAGDPAGDGCEHLAPLVVSTPQIEGNPRVANQLAVGRSGITGEVTAISTRWFSCPQSVAPKPGQVIDDPALGCRAAATGATFVPGDRELGRVIYGSSTLTWSMGTEPGGLAGPFGPLTEALPTDPAPPTPTATPKPQPTQTPQAEPPPGDGGQGTPGESFTVLAKRLALTKLGSGAVASNLSLGAGTAVFETAASLGGKVPVTPTSSRTLAAVVCERACSLTVDGRVKLTPAGRGRHTKLIELRRQSFSISAGTAAAVPFNASAPKRLKMQAAKKAKLTLSFALRASDGTIRRATKRYVVRVHAPGTPR